MNQSSLAKKPTRKIALFYSSPGISGHYGTLLDAGVKVTESGVVKELLHKIWAVVSFFNVPMSHGKRFLISGTN